MTVHASVLDAALRICGRRRGWTFRPAEIVLALPGLNAASVRTHVMSRCCVNAPAHHAHRWAYFRRVGRGLYEILPALRKRHPGPLPKVEGARSIDVAVRETAGRYVVESGPFKDHLEGTTLGAVLSRVLRLVQGRREIRLLIRLEPPPLDPVTAAYARGIDRTQIRENLRLSVEDRLEKLCRWQEAMAGMRGVARRAGRRAAGR